MSALQNHRSSISVLLLAGGNSVRMGQDKGLLPIDNTTFAEKLIALSKQVSDHVFLSVGAHNAKNYQNISIPLITDEQPNKGPLGGIYSAKNHIKTAWVFILSIDSPLITINSLELLWNSKKDKDGAVFSSGDKNHPLIALYHHRALAQWQQAFEEGELKLQNVLAQLNVEKVQVPNELQQSVKNINTQKEYLKLKTV